MRKHVRMLLCAPLFLADSTGRQGQRTVTPNCCHDSYWAQPDAEWPLLMWHISHCEPLYLQRLNKCRQLKVISMLLNLQSSSLEHDFDRSDTTGDARPGLLP